MHANAVPYHVNFLENQAISKVRDVRPSESQFLQQKFRVLLQFGHFKSVVSHVVSTLTRLLLRRLLALRLAIIRLGATSTRSGSF